MSKCQMHHLSKIVVTYQQKKVKNIVKCQNFCLLESKNSAKFHDNTFWNSNDMTYFWAKNVIFYAKTSNCCKMAPDEDTEWPNISKCSFFQALTLCQISCFPPKTQDWLAMPPHYSVDMQNLSLEDY